MNTNAQVVANPPQLLDVGQAAKKSGLTKYLIRKLCDEKRIVAYDIAGRWRIDPVSLDRYMSKQLNL